MFGAYFNTLNAVWRRPGFQAKKYILGLLVICVFFVTPRSLAEDLLSPIIGTVGAPVSTPSESPSPTDSPTPTDSPLPQPALSTTPDTTGEPSSSSSSLPPVPPFSDSPMVSVVSASPKPIPPHAISDQNIQIGVPSTISIDPRAHSVFLPRLQIGKVGTLLVCGYTNATAVYFGVNLPGVQSAGSGSSFFRISGPTPLVMSTLNGETGAHVISTTKAITSSFILFSFVALSEPSIDQALCNDGSPSNNRTIIFRALNMDLNMVKDPVRLK